MVYMTAFTTIPSEKRDELVEAFLKWSKVAKDLPRVISHGFYADLND